MFDHATHVANRYARNEITCISYQAVMEMNARADVCPHRSIHNRSPSNAAPVLEAPDQRHHQILDAGILSTQEPQENQGEYEINTPALQLKDCFQNTPCRDDGICFYTAGELLHCEELKSESRPVPVACS